MKEELLSVVKPTHKSFASRLFCRRKDQESLNVASSSFAIRVNLLHPQLSLFLNGFLLSLWCFSILVNYFFHAGFLQFKGSFVRDQNN